jgi:hypothetical protein
MDLMSAAFPRRGELIEKRAVCRPSTMNSPAPANAAAYRRKPNSQSLTSLRGEVLSAAGLTFLYQRVVFSGRSAAVRRNPGEKAASTTKGMFV